MIVVVTRTELGSVAALIAALARNGIAVAVAHLPPIAPEPETMVINAATDWNFEPPAIKEKFDYVDWLAERREEALAGIRKLMAWHSRMLRPWLLIAKRFDFRSAPRWSRKRWRSKT